MELRKNPKIALEGKRGLFMSIGLCLSLGFVLVAFEWKSEMDPIMAFETQTEAFEDILDIQQTRQEPPEPPKPKVIQPVFKEAEEPIVEEDLDIDFGDFEDPIEDLDLPVVDDEDIDDVPEIFNIVESMPTPEGGMKAFYKFLQKNMKYPRQAVRMGVEGKVFVQFVVDTQGNVTDIQVVKGIHTQCDQEAMRVIKAYPGWVPGKQRGNPVKVRMMMPITFTLQ